MLHLSIWIWGCRNLDITLGLESSIVYDIFDVIEENCDLDEALIKDTRYENLYFYTRSANA